MEIALWGTLSALLSLVMPLAFGLIVGTVILARDMTLLVGLVGALVTAALTLGAAWWFKLQAVKPSAGVRLGARSYRVG